MEMATVALEIMPEIRAEQKMKNPKITMLL